MDDWPAQGCQTKILARNGCETLDLFWPHLHNVSMSRIPDSFGAKDKASTLIIEILSTWQHWWDELEWNWPSFFFSCSCSSIPLVFFCGTQWDRESDISREQWKMRRYFSCLSIQMDEKGSFLLVLYLFSCNACECVSQNQSQCPEFDLVPISLQNALFMFGTTFWRSSRPLTKARLAKLAS